MRLGLTRLARRITVAVIGTTRALKFNLPANSMYIPVIGA